MDGTLARLEALLPLAEQTSDVCTIAVCCLALRRVSSTLRHLAWEFTDFLPLPLGRLEPAC